MTFRAIAYAAMMKSMHRIRTTQKGIRILFFQITLGCAMLNDGCVDVKVKIVVCLEVEIGAALSFYSNGRESMVNKLRTS